MATIPQIVTTGGTAGKGEAIVSGSGKLNQAITLLNALDSRVTVTESGLTVLAGVPGAIDDIYAQLSLTQESISLVVSSAEVGRLSDDVNGAVGTIPVTATPISLSPGDFLYIPNTEEPESPYEFEVAGASDIAAGATSIPIQPRGGSGDVTIEALEDAPVILDGFTLLAKIEILRGEINSKVSQTQFDDLGDEISALETLISQNASAITLKANQTDVDTLTGRVDSAEASITVNAEAITLLASAGFSLPLGTLAVAAAGTITQITLTDPIPINVLDGETLKIYNEVTDTTYEVVVNGNFAAEDDVTIIAIDSVSVTAPIGSEVSLLGDSILSRIQLNADSINLAVTGERYDNDVKGSAFGFLTPTTTYTNVDIIGLSAPGLVGVLYAGDEVEILPIGRGLSTNLGDPKNQPSRRTLGSNPTNSAATYPNGATQLRFTANVTIQGPYVVRLVRRGGYGVISEINLSAAGVLISGPKITLVGNTEFQSVQTSVNTALNNSNNALSQVAAKLNLDFSNASTSTIINGGYIQSGTLALTAFNSGSQEALVLKAGVIAAINISTEGFGNLKIQASKLDLQGVVTISSLTSDIANNLTTIDGGKITASSQITVGSGNNVAILSGSNATFRMWVGHSVPGSAPFRVTQAGAVTATNATITGSFTSQGGAAGFVTVDGANGVRVQFQGGAFSDTHQHDFDENGLSIFRDNGAGTVKNIVLNSNPGSTDLLTLSRNYTDVLKIKSTGPAVFDLASTVGGAVFPRMTNTQRNAISSPTTGLMVYNTTDRAYQSRDANGGWSQMSIPYGTTAQRPTSPGNGFLYYDSTVDGLFAYTIAEGWQQLAFVS
jgi:hypothetical protein